MTVGRRPHRSLVNLLAATRIGLPLIAGCSGSAADTAHLTSAVAILDVNVIPMDSERVLRHQTIVARNGRIAAIGPTGSVAIPSGAKTVDGSGKYVLPGLTDFHVHLRDTTELLSYLAHGVTTVVHLSGPLGNVPDVLGLRRRISEGTILGPTIYSSGPILDGDPPINPGVSIPVSTPEDARRIVAQQVDAGVDLIKVYNNLPNDALRAAIAAAHQRNRVVIGHIPRAGGRARALQRALLAGLDVIAHGEELFFTYFYEKVEAQLDRGLVPMIDDRLIPEAVGLVYHAGVAVIPNLSFVAMTRAQLENFPAVLREPEVRFLHPSVVNLWKEQNPTTRRDLERFNRRERAKYDFLRRLTFALSAAGVPLLVGTDASAPGLFPGASAQLELRELVKAGLTPYRALTAGTRSAGGFLAQHVKAEPFGTITPGYRADLILLRRSPLAEIANIAQIEGVLVRGTWVSTQELQQLRNKAAAANLEAP